MSKKQTPFNNALLFRILAIVFGAISIAMGWEAISQGYFWNSGYNARIGTETTRITLSWVMIGTLLVLAGIFPWKWLINRHKR